MNISSQNEVKIEVRTILASAFSSSKAQLDALRLFFRSFMPAQSVGRQNVESGKEVPGAEDQIQCKKHCAGTI